ncbi:MAG: hypothetical protein HY914_07660 [Desulfomonile tiedjei]|nr:hypothetical protein [Desulfomonile tiedjei]
MEIVGHVVVAALSILRESALYLLLGLLIAGLIRVYIQPVSIAHYLRRGRFRSVLYSSLLGIPIPI